MKKQLSLTRRLALCLALGGFLLPTIVQTASADAITSDETSTVTTTVYVGTANGTLTSSNNNATFRDKWQSTNLPALTLECTGNQMENASDTIALYSTASSCTYNLKAADGWTIKSVSLELKHRYNTEVGTTVTLNGGTAQTITYTKQTFTVTDLSATTTVPIVVTRGTTYNGSGNWVLISACSVTLERETTGRAYDVNLTNGAFVNGNSAKTYWSSWQSSATSPTLTVKTADNCMQTNGNLINVYPGQSGASYYNIFAGSKYSIAGYLLTFKNATANTNAVTLQVNGTDYAVSDSAQTVFIEGLKEPTLGFSVSGHNHGVVLSTLTAYVTPYIEGDRNYTPLFITSEDQTTPYRIPAIAKTYDGTLLALSDYRTCGGDIGNGDVDIVARRSTDNGVTWEAQTTIIDGSSSCGYGDAALVADSKSDKVLLMCASGKVTYASSTRDTPIGVARFTSSNNGKTWSGPTDVTESIYGIFDSSANGKAKGLFFGSGRICQSKIVKEGDYYRLYAALCVREIGNYVIYSDDFGTTWKALGGVDAKPAPSGDEPKCEELPDGTVILSSRMKGGRYFNLFSYTDVSAGEGSWGSVVSSTSSTGTYANTNATDGEILVLPATRKSDGKNVYVVLQSVPFGPTRSNVGIHYKELASYDDLKSPSALASDWDGHYKVSTTASGYSTMIMQANDSIAFLFEESTYGYDYTILYRQLSLEGITNGAYSYNSSADRTVFVRSILEERINSTTTPTVGTAVGMYEPASAATVTSTINENTNEALTLYDSNPSAQGYVDAVAKLNSTSSSTDLKTIAAEENVTYVLTNRKYPTYRLKLNTTTSGETTTYSYTGTADDIDDTQKFQLVKASDNTWYIWNETAGVYMCAAPTKDNTQFSGTTEKSSAGTFTLTSNTNGYSYFSCTATTGTHPCPHLAAAKNIVRWGTTAEASHWVITRVEDDDVAAARTNLCNAIATAALYQFGTGLGQYSGNSSDLAAAVETASTAALDFTKDSTSLAAATTALTTAESAFTLNQPTAGMFLRIRTTKESYSTQPYLLPENSSHVPTSDNMTRVKFGTEGSGKETIFYFTGNALLSYSQGNYLTNNYVTSGGTTGETYSQAYYSDFADPAPIVFSAATTGTTIGYYTLKYGGDRYLYANLTGTSTYFGDAYRTNPTHEHCNFELEEVTSIPVTISAAGWATFYTPVALALPEGVTAYYSKKVEDYLQLHAFTDGVVPANTPVLLQGDQGTYYFTTTSTAASTTDDATTTYGDGTLTGTLAAIASTYTEGVTSSYNLTLQNPSTGIGFYRYKGSKIRGFSSYIPANQAAGVKGMSFSLTPTDIDHVETEQPTQSDAIYDLQGRRVNKTGRGIYIIGGKKVICL